MSQISTKNSFGKVVFPFLVGNFMSRGGNYFFGSYFIIVYPIFDIFAVFWFFLDYFMWLAFHCQIHSGKYFSELGSIGIPP